jgi:hypothetical protein
LILRLFDFDYDPPGANRRGSLFIAVFHLGGAFDRPCVFILVLLGSCAGNAIFLYATI